MVLLEGITTEGKLTSKGQVTLPKEIRDRLGVKPGDTVEFVADREGVRVRRKISAAAIDKWRGYLTHLEGRDVDELVREMREG